MTWEDLNKDNIEEIKELYIEYLQENKNKEYMANLMTFEEFINKELKKCERCDKPVYQEEKYCECCYDDLFAE